MTGAALAGQPGEEPPADRCQRGYARPGVRDGQAADRQHRRGERGRPGRGRAGRPGRGLAAWEHVSLPPHSLWPAALPVPGDTPGEDPYHAIFLLE